MLMVVLMVVLVLVLVLVLVPADTGTRISPRCSSSSPRALRSRPSKLGVWCGVVGCGGMVVRCTV
jgi:hypothetical protein